MSALLNTILRLKTATDAPIEIPNLVGAAEPHQRVGVAFAALAQRSLLAYQVGLGKTFMSIALTLLLRSRGVVRNTLVLCQSAKKTDWLDEYGRFAPSLQTVLVEGDGKGAKAKRNNLWLHGQNNAVTIASYETCRIDLLDKQKLPDDSQKLTFYEPSVILRMLKYDLVVFDEPTVFKSWGTVLNLALGYLVNMVQPRFAVGLSGTPIQKSVEDAFAIVDKLAPGYLGDKTWFDENFTVREQINGKSKAVGVKNEEVLATLLAPIVLVGERDKIYPGRVVNRFKLNRVELTPGQIEAYDKVVAGTLPEMDQTALLVQFQTLEKIADTLAWFPELKSRASAKLDSLRKWLTGDLQDEKLVIFSKTILPLTEANELVLKPLGIEAIFYTGREDQKKREKDRKRFLEDRSCRVALISTAAEMGLNFHSAHYIWFYNHIYNPARVAQIIGRIDRVMVQTSGFLCSIHTAAIGTIEDNLVPKLHREAEISHRLIGTTNKFDDLKGEWINQMSRESLFSLIRQRRIPNLER